MWEPQPLTTLWAFTACYRDSFTFFLPYVLNLQKLFEVRSSMFNAQLRKLRFRSTDRLAGLNLNIQVNKRDCFTLTDFCAILYYIQMNKCIYFLYYAIITDILLLIGPIPLWNTISIFSLLVFMGNSAAMLFKLYTEFCSSSSDTCKVAVTFHRLLGAAT
jgi:hypothetical protein